MYCLAADVLAILPGLPQTTTAAGYTSTAAIITAHITRADALIDGKLARRYAVPFAATATSTPPLVSSISQDVTAYYAYRSLFTSDGANRNEYIDDLLKLAMDTLDQLSRGEIDLVNTSGSVLAESIGSDRVYSTTEAYTPIFDMDDATRWRVDPDLITDARSAR